MKETVPDGPDGPGPLLAESAPATLGRYEILGVLGTGAMGVVYEALDPELECRRAIKYMRPRREADKARARFLREAQAMARLEHRNVVAVHDVGTHNDRPFVVMDLVRGSTLDAWIQDKRPGWKTVLEKFIEAGRGLAAAHDAGLVHRDFKPTNVLVGDDGAVKVVDFGLVRVAAESVESPGEPGVPKPVDSGLTQTGGLLGTPAYMAPEQFRSAPANAASDQFSFCVALFEALYGVHPFGGDNLPAIVENSERGAFTQPPSTEVPSWTLEALKRGLGPDPSSRWPSMRALLDALDRRRRRSRRGLVAGVAAVALLGLGFGLNALAPTARAWWSPVRIHLGLAQADIEAPTRTGIDPEIGPYAFSTAANKGRVIYDVELPAAGRYFLWGLVWERTLGGERGDADSLFVYVDGGAERLWHAGCQNETGLAIVAAGNWRWQRIDHMPNSDSDCVYEELAFELAAGPHRVVLRNRESAVTDLEAIRFARLVITNDRNFRPALSD